MVVISPQCCVRALQSPKRLGLSLGLAALLLATALGAGAAESSASTTSTLSGRVVEQVVDNFDSGRAAHLKYLDTGEELVKLSGDTDSGLSRLTVGEKATVRGSLAGGELHVEDVIAVGKPREGDYHASFTGPRKVLVMVAAGRDLSIASQTMFGDVGESAKRIIEWQSGGTQTITGNVTGPIEGLPSSGCPYRETGEAMRAATKAAGVDPDSYDHEVYVLPQGFSCGWAGLGTVGTPGADPGKGLSWIAPRGLYPMVLAHELGHNFGLRHANSLDCDRFTTAGGYSWSPLPPVNPGSRSCKEEEYGDVNDFMGGQSAALGSRNLERIGARTNASTVMATTAGNFSLGDAHSSSAQVRELLVPWEVQQGGRVTGYLSIEARRSRLDGVLDFWDIGCSRTCARERMQGGVLIRSVQRTATGQPSEIAGSKVLTYRSASDSFASARSQIWPAGAVLEDASRGIRLRVLSANSGGAEIAVEQLPDTRDTLPPDAPTNLSGSQSESDPGLAKLGWRGSGDNIGVERYRIFKGNDQVAELPASSACDSYGNCTGSAPFDFRQPSETYSVKAVDAAANASAPSAPVTVRRDYAPKPPVRELKLSGKAQSGVGRTGRLSALVRSTVPDTTVRLRFRVNVGSRAIASGPAQRASVGTESRKVTSRLSAKMRRKVRKALKSKRGRKVILRVTAIGQDADGRFEKDQTIRLRIRS